MRRLRVQSARSRRLLITAAAGTIAAVILLLVLGLEYRPQVPNGDALRQSTATATSDSSVLPSPLALSVFDQPRPVPEIHFQDEQGHDLTLADFRSRVVLLNIWATWCVPCREEMPTLDRLQARLGGKDFLVMALSIDRKGIEAVRDFYKETGVKNLAVYIDHSGKGSYALAIPGVPTTLLIDRQGREVARKMGAAEWDSPEMVRLIERTMRPQSASAAEKTR